MRIFSLIFVVVMSVFLATGCELSEPTSRDKGAKEQESIMKRATTSVPTYSPSNFLTRKAVNKWMERMDVPNKTFYIYLLGNNGNHLGYYIGQTRPISICTLLTPPDRFEEGDRGGSWGDFVVQAPSLDGVYGKGGCDSYYFFDAETDAYVEIKGLNFFVSDQPLSIDVDPIHVKTE